MNRQLCSPALAGTFLVVATLAGCGGGGGDAAPAPAPAAVTITGVAADGALQGATACYDLNDNGACDAAEPSSAATDADGRFSLTVDAAAAGRHRVVVVVPATAIDKETGQAVGSAFTLQSPATGNSSAHSVFASPLSTLVQAHMDATGATVTAASDFIQAQATLALSPLADFTGAGAEARQAATVARLVTLATQAQSQAVASVVGQVDISGATVSQADLDRAVAKAVIGVLPALAGAVTDPSVVNAATPAQQQAAMAAAAQAVIAQQSELTADNAKAMVGLAKLPADSSANTPTAGATLRALSFTDTNTWFYRSMEASAADNTPDASGQVRFYDVRRQSALTPFGTPLVSGWSFGASKLRETDLHWNGSAWVGCPFSFRSTASVRDAQGRNSYDYCDKVEEGTSVRSAVDIAGKTLRSVIVDTIRAFPGADSGVAYSAWGPANLDLLGSTTFPDGARLLYQTSQPLKTAPGYDVHDTNRVGAYPVAIAAGGDARSTAGLACAGNLTGQFALVSTLEDLVSRNPGSPCVFNKGTNADGSSIDANEWWGNGTASLGSVAAAATQPAGTGAYYTTTALLRVGFAASGNQATYYLCLQRKSDGSVRNCTVAGTGTYTIETLGDGRAMSFTGLPAIAQRTGFSRVFVERGGHVYFGYRNPVGQINPQLRLNLTAANALLEQLGIPVIAPLGPSSAADPARQALFANAKGAWSDVGTTGGRLIRFGDGGAMLLAQTEPGTPHTTTGVEQGLLDIDPASGAFTGLLEVDSNGEAGVSHPSATDRIVSITASALTTQDGSIARLADDPAGLVGLWALGSATELRTIHIAFFGNGRLMLVDPLGETDPASTCGIAHQGPPGVEFASYTFDAATGALHVFGKLHDSNGCAGLFDSSQGAIQGGTANTTADLVLTFSADKKTLQADGSTWYRIAPQ
ncbi:MAG TPA: hypothetical protein VF169_20470 [Albitalea sp.]|uniref:hypothetical protein n=1 Tax=Piscinibacter sp. TaxID=1903157 RepID=UPI002ED2CDDA